MVAMYSQPISAKHVNTRLNTNYGDNKSSSSFTYVACRHVALLQNYRANLAAYAFSPCMYNCYATAMVQTTMTPILYKAIMSLNTLHIAVQEQQQPFYHQLLTAPAIKNGGFYWSKFLLNTCLS